MAPSAVSAFARRVAARVNSAEPGVAARNAEVIIRVALGEHDLGSAVAPHEILARADIRRAVELDPEFSAEVADIIGPGTANGRHRNLADGGADRG